MLVNSMEQHLFPYIKLDHIKGHNLAKLDFITVQDMLDVFLMLFKTPLSNMASGMMYHSVIILGAGGEKVQILRLPKKKYPTENNLYCNGTIVLEMFTFIGNSNLDFNFNCWCVHSDLILILTGTTPFVCQQMSPPKQSSLMHSKEYVLQSLLSSYCRDALTNDATDLQHRYTGDDATMRK